MKQISFKNRILIAFAIVFTIMLLAMLYIVLQIHILKENTQLIYEHPLKVSNAIRDIKIETYKIARNLRNLQFTDSSSQFAQIIAENANSDKDIEAKFQIIFKQYLGNQQDVDSAYNAFLTWRKIRQNFYQFYNEKRNDSIFYYIKYTNHSAVNKLLEHTNLISDFSKNKAESAMNLAIATEQQTYFTSLFLILFSSLVVLFLSLYLAGSITRPIQKFIREATSIFSNQTSEIQENYRNEEALFNFTINELRNSYLNIERQNEEIRIYNEQLTSYNNTLEDAVKQRTILLQEQKEEIGVQNEELIQLNEEYIQLNEELHQRNDELFEMKERIIHSEENYRLLITEMQQGLAVHEIICDELGRVVDYRFLFANPSFETLTGLKCSDIIGKTVLEIMPNTEKIWFEKYGHVAKTGEALSFSNFSQELGKYYEVVAFRPQPNQFAVIVTDVSERKINELLIEEKNKEIEAQIEKYKQINEEVQRAKELTQRSEEKYRFLTENIIDVVWILDLVENRFTYLSPSVYKMRGYTTEEVMQLSLNESLTPESAEKVSRLITKRIPIFYQNPNEQIVYYDEVEQPCKNGTTVMTETITYYRLNPENQHLQVIGTSRNINERKQAEEKLKAGEAKFRSYIESAPDGIFITYPDGFYADVNSASCRQLGYSRDEFLKMHASQIVLRDDLERARNSFEIIKQTGSYSDEYQFVRKDGSTFYGLLSAVKISETQYLGFVKDIDIIKETERELIEAKEHAEESDRLKSAFLANMSHEIRTPMNGILGFSQMLAKPTLTIEKRSQYAEIIRNCGTHLLSIIDDLIDIAKIEANQIKIEIRPVAVNNILSELHALLLPKARQSKIELIPLYPIDNKTVVIDTDESRLRQIITNLLNNAIKFTKVGSITFGFTIKSDIIEFFVTDTGVGIPEEQQSRIFERFHQVETETSKMTGGTGLGLSISKALVELLGGKIWVKSEQYKGATFYFTIPYNYTEQPLNPNTAKSESILSNFSNSTILIAEDEDVNYQFLEEFIADLQMKPLRANNGEEAFLLAKTNPEIKLILMDLKMPVLDGYETTRMIKNLRPTLPIIAQSAYAQSGDKIKALQAGCDDYISKPIKDNILLALITKYLNKQEN